jgi:hypothetical protein
MSTYEKVQRHGGAVSLPPVSVSGLALGIALTAVAAMFALASVYLDPVGALDSVDAADMFFAFL